MKNRQQTFVSTLSVSSAFTKDFNDCSNSFMLEPSRGYSKEENNQFRHATVLRLMLYLHIHVVLIIEIITTSYGTSRFASNKRLSLKYLVNYRHLSCGHNT